MFMDIKRWIARRETSWQQLDRLLRQVESQGLKSLRPEDIKQLASLYRFLRPEGGAVGLWHYPHVSDPRPGWGILFPQSCGS